MRGILKPLGFGRALTEYMIEGIQYVEEEGNLPPNGCWNIYPDSYTRKLDFKSAAAGIERTS